MFVLVVCVLDLYFAQEYPEVPFVMVCTTLLHVCSLSMSYTKFNAVVIFVGSHLYIQVVKLPFNMCSIKQLQCNLSKPDPNGTKYFVRFRQDPDYSDSPFSEEFLYCSSFDNKVCLLLDGLAYILHFISSICKSNVNMCFRRIFTQGSPFQ